MYIVGFISTHGPMTADITGNENFAQPVEPPGHSPFGSLLL